MVRALGGLIALAAVAAGVTVWLAAPAGGPASRETAPAAATTTPTTTTVPVAVPPALSWQACGAYQCATLDVPLDYAMPAGPHIGIALERRPATDPSDRIGSLVINPGGPGESGLGNFAKDLPLLPAGVLARFDVVTFDPRGVGQSSPVHCEGDDYAGPMPDPLPQTAAEEQVLVNADRAYAEACLSSSGALLLEHVGTVDVARDLDAMRQALGDAKLTYLGISYGTILGATYAEMFSTHVRAMVLDGALDPSLSTAQLADGQASGFENSLSTFFSWCTANPGSCAWHPAGDPHAAYEAMVDAIEAHPLPAGNTTLGVGEFFTGTFGSLYAQSFWPGLGRALAAVAAGDGGPMLGLYNSYERVGDPSFSGDANNAITCLDHPVPHDPSVYFAQAQAAEEVAPDFGPLFSWGAITCAVWPTPVADERVVGPAHDPGAPPILVVGTTHDPATPYAWAQSLAAQLQGGVLLTREGVDHVALFTSSCVRSFDEAYLVTLATPPPGTVCQ